MAENAKTESAGKKLFLTLNERMTFQVSLLLAPLAYCIHQLEESSGGFRNWRLRHFPDNNPLPVEYVFVILTALSLAFIILHSIRKNKATARAALILFMMTQVNNALYHAATGLYFQDYSPGTVTGLLLYLPVNAFIIMKAVQEGWINWKHVPVLFILGVAGFWSFEMGGPLFIAIILGLVLTYLIVAEVKEAAVR